MKTKAALIGAAGVAGVAIAAALLLWPHPQTPSGARVLIHGGDGGGLPRALPQDEHLDAAQLERASNDAVTAGLQAFVASCTHDHVVFERFGHGVEADSVIDSGPFAQALLALAVGVAVQSDNLPVPALSGFDPSRLRDAIEAAAHQSYADFLSRRLWSRLYAAPAEVVLPAVGAQVPADCCFEARLLDRMRIAGLLLDDGRFEGTGRDTAGLGCTHVAAHIRGRRPGIWSRACALGSRRAAICGRGRILSARERALAAVADADAEAGGAVRRAARVGYRLGRETRLPNLVIAALTEVPTQHDASQRLQQLVPGHEESR